MGRTAQFKTIDGKASREKTWRAVSHFGSAVVFPVVCFVLCFEKGEVGEQMMPTSLVDQNNASLF